jgi:DNA-binding Lrp family transcriptional regulator
VLDDVDLALLRSFDADGKQPVAELAQSAAVSRATAYSRLQRLERLGVLRGHSPSIDPKAVGLHVSALVLLSGGQRHWRDLRTRLEAIPQVKYAAYLAGAFDIVVLVRERTMQSLSQLVLEQLQDLPGVRNTQTLFVMEEVVDRVNAWPAD